MHLTLCEQQGGPAVTGSHALDGDGASPRVSDGPPDAFDLLHPATSVLFPNDVLKVIDLRFSQDGEARRTELSWKRCFLEPLNFHPTLVLVPRAFDEGPDLIDRSADANLGLTLTIPANVSYCEDRVLKSGVNRSPREICVPGESPVGVL